MSYYATGGGSLTIKAGTHLGDIDAALDHFDRVVWTIDDIGPVDGYLSLDDTAVTLSYSGRWKTEAAMDELAHLAPYVVDGQHLQFTSDSDSTWRYVFERGQIVEHDATFVPVAPAGAPAGPATVELPDGTLRIFEPDADEGDLGRMYVLDVLGFSLLIRQRADGMFVHVDEDADSTMPEPPELCTLCHGPLVEGVAGQWHHTEPTVDDDHGAFFPTSQPLIVEVNNGGGMVYG